NSADWAALFSAAAFNCQHGDEVAGLQRFLVQCPDRQVRRDPRQLQAALWQQLLSTGNVTRETDFFQQGGDSLLATRLTGQLHQAGYEAQLRDL
ncbi:phosphopantetheine-binding protein, partial [Escherichia coli]|nr:phosphopantetheine-binding protein [Escherichia coli]